jgi:hypothetical protein
MPVTDNVVAPLRAQLSGKLEEYLQLYAELDPVSKRTAYRALVSAAFFTAVERRFGKSGSDGEVIEFVSDVRSRSDDAADKIDPRTAERIIRAVYTSEQIDDIDPKTSWRVQLLLLVGLISDEQLDAGGLEDFLTQARRLADQSLTRQAPRS